MSYKGSFIAIGLGRRGQRAGMGLWEGRGIDADDQNPVI